MRERLRAMIVEGRMRRGEMLPAYREIARRLQVSLVTVQRAMLDLHREGLVEVRHGSGVMVAHAPKAEELLLRRLAIVTHGTYRGFFNASYVQDIFRGLWIEGVKHLTDVRVISIPAQGPVSVETLALAGMDAVLVVGVSNREYMRQFAQAQLPCVVADEFDPELALDFVTVDNQAAARTVVEHLAKLGHRQIAYLDGSHTDHVTGHVRFVDASDVLERREAYLAAMRALGLGRHVHIFYGRASHAAAGLPLTVETLVRMKQRPTALVSFAGGTGVRLTQLLRERALRVPEDISFAGVAASEIVVDGDRLVTGCVMDFKEMGQKAMQILRERIQGSRPDKAERHMIGHTFYAGATAGPPKS